MTSDILYKYNNGNLVVTLYKNGTKVTLVNGDEMSPSFPDNIDVLITRCCSQNCPFCYENCTPNGQHAILFNSDGSPQWNWMNHLHAGQELALNGNDLDHPQLESFLKFLRKQDVVPNITVNQNQFMSNIDKIKYYVDNELVFGVGVSFLKQDDKFIEEFSKLKNGVIHTIAGVTSIEDYKWLGKFNLKILILGYKDRGRGSLYKSSHDVKFNKLIYFLYDILNGVRSDLSYDIISFDNLALTQLDIKKNFFSDKSDKWDTMYQGNDGLRTFYIDLVEGKFAKDSTSYNDVYYDINDLTTDEMLNFLKNNSNA